MADPTIDEPILDRLETPTPANGSKPAPKTHTFTHEGVDPLTVELNDHISSITLLQLGAAVGMGDDAGNEFVAVIWEALTDTFAKGELRRFKDWAKEADPTMKELMQMIGDLIGKVTGRPFEEESPSPDGRQETPTGSTGLGDAEPVTPAAEASAL